MSEEMPLPSGRELRYMDFSAVRKMAEIGTIRWSDEPFTLKSGIKSNVYVFGREDLTDNPELLWHLGQIVWRTAFSRLKERRHGKRVGFIGIPTAGTALAVATGFNPNCFSRVMREWRKEDYGAHKAWVNGKYSVESEFVTVDNVITDGKTKVETFERLAEGGYPVREMLHLVLVDRQQGGLEKLQAQDYWVKSVFNLLDLTYAFGELGLWPKDRIKAVEEEIKAHQFT